MNNDTKKSEDRLNQLNQANAKLTQTIRLNETTARELAHSHEERIEYNQHLKETLQELENWITNKKEEQKQLEERTKNINDQAKNTVLDTFQERQRKMKRLELDHETKLMHLKRQINQLNEQLNMRIDALPILQRMELQAELQKTTEKESKPFGSKARVFDPFSYKLRVSPSEFHRRFETAVIVSDIEQQQIKPKKLDFSSIDDVEAKQMELHHERTPIYETPKTSHVRSRIGSGMETPQTPAQMGAYYYSKSRIYQTPDVLSEAQKILQRTKQAREERIARYYEPNRQSETEKLQQEEQKAIEQPPEQESSPPVIYGPHPKPYESQESSPPVIYGPHPKPSESQESILPEDIDL